jgi:hypothetical protein
MIVIYSPSMLTNTISTLDSKGLALTKVRMVIFPHGYLELEPTISYFLHSNNILSQHKICSPFYRTRPFGPHKSKLLIYLCIDLTTKVKNSQKCLSDKTKTAIFVDSHTSLVVILNQLNLFSRETLLAKDSAFGKAI